MAFLNETFVAADLPQSDRNFDPIPPGWYDVTITSAEVRQTKSGTGQYIAVRYDVTGPMHQGRVIFGNLNIRNASPQAESIGRQQLGELMRAIGLAKVEDTDQLIGAHLQIKVKIRESSGYDPQNDVSGFRASGSVSASVAMPKPQAAARAQSGGAKAPWAK